MFRQRNLFLSVLTCCFIIATSGATVHAQDPCDPATNAAAVAEARQAIDNINTVADILGREGLPVSPRLRDAASRMSNALQLIAVVATAGVDLGEAAGQADAEVQRIVSNRKYLCQFQHSEPEIVCEARIDRQWQARNVNAVLNWSNRGSVVRRVAQKWRGVRCDPQARGVRVDVTPTGHTKDVSGLRGQVMRVPRATQ